MSSPSGKRSSSSSTKRASVHFDIKTLVSHPETIDSALKKRLSAVACSSSLANSRRQSIVVASTSSTPRRRRRSIVLPLAISVPDIQHSSCISPLKRRYSTISPPIHQPTTTTTPSPRKRRFSGISSTITHTQTRVLSTIPPSPNKPPLKICAQVNQRIRSTFHYPNFDFSQHVQHRSYTVRSQLFERSECVTMLDTGVDNLLQRMFQKLPAQLDTSMNVDIKPSPGKGLGMFSRKEIPIGKTFLIEYPTIITPYVIGLSGGLSSLYADIFSRLSTPVFEELMDLSSSDETKDVHEAIMRINALAIELPVPDEEFSELNTHRAIFLKTSRCNHSCGPNTKWEWDLNHFSLVLTAVRPIKQGEEITIPYIAPNMPFKDRQNILSNFYGFNCQCPFCTNDDNTQQIDLARSTLPSSGRRNLESTSLPTFEEWCLDPTLPNDILINSHLQSIESTTVDDITISHHLDAIAICYGALEDTDNFRKWMGRVRQVRLKNRPDQKSVFDRWIENPLCFPVWGWRRVFCAGGGEVGGDGDGDCDSSGGSSSDAGLSACVRMGMFESFKLK